MYSLALKNKVPKNNPVVESPNDETVTEYGDRIRNILKDIIEVIEEANSAETANVMIKSAREMARESFFLGMKPNLVLRVRLEKPNTLQEAISIGRGMEWELVMFKI